MILSILILIYIQYGLLVLTQIIIWLLVYLLSNILIGINPFSKHLHIIRIMSIIAISLILYINYNHSSIFIGTALIAPLSIDKITFMDETESSVILDGSVNEKLFSEISIELFEEFIKSLEDEMDYVVTIDFIPDIFTYDINHPRMIISRAFLINKHSSPVTIHSFVIQQLELMVKKYCIDSLISNKTSNLLITYSDVLLL